MTKTLGNFELTAEGGSFTDSEIVVMLGENGTGKTTFVQLWCHIARRRIRQDGVVCVLETTNGITQIPWHGANVTP